MAGIVDEAGGVAERINPELEFLAELRVGVQSSRTKSIRPRMPAGSSPWMPAKMSDLDPGLDDLGALEDEARQPEPILAGAPEAEGIRPQSIRRADLDEEREEDFLDRMDS